MDIRVLKALMKLRGWNASQLARAACVSRQAVSLWLNASGAELDLRISTVEKLARALGTSVDTLLNAPLQVFEPDTYRILSVSFLWDRLYPSLEEFVTALCRREPRAAARLIQIVGLFMGAQILGRRVWRDFKKLAPLIAPERRHQCEVIWQSQKSLGLI